MTNLEKLLDGIEVEWFTLGDERFVKIDNSNRRAVKHSERVSGPYPYYGANNIQDNVEGYTHNGTYILLAEDGTNSIENYSVQWATGKFWANNHVHVLRGIGCLNSRFLFHYLQTVNFTPFLTGGGRPKLTKNKLRNIQIPIPCPNSPKKSLEIQLAIVETLDKFTKLEAELEAELDCRKRQYDYYRNKLLSYDILNCEGESSNLEKLLNNVEVESKTLGEICEVLRGKRLTKRDLVDNAKYPIFHGGLEPIGYYSKNNRLANSAMLINVGASAGTVGFCNCDFWSSDGCFCFSHTNILNQRYLFYALQSIEPIIKSKVRKAGIPTLDNKCIERLCIPIPFPDNQEKSLEIQLVIVSILDKFDKLTTSISEGLPAEIELRRKQYEYYRNKLLSFPNAKITQ